MALYESIMQAATCAPIKVNKDIYQLKELYDAYMSALKEEYLLQIHQENVTWIKNK